MSDFLGHWRPADLRQNLFPPRGYVYSCTHILVSAPAGRTCVDITPYWRNADGYQWYTSLPPWPLSVELSGRSAAFSAMLRDISLTLVQGAEVLKEHGC